MSKMLILYDTQVIIEKMKFENVHEGGKQNEEEKSEIKGKLQED